MKHFSESEKQRVIDLFFSEKLTTQQVVDRIEYPTRQNLERWLRKDERYSERIAINFYPVDLKIKTVEMVLTRRYTLNEIAASLGPSHLQTLSIIGQTRCGIMDMTR